MDCKSRRRDSLKPHSPHFIRLTLEPESIKVAHSIRAYPGPCEEYLSLSSTPTKMVRAVFQAALLFALFSHAFACSCIFSTFPQRYRSASRVVKARVVSVTVVPPPPPPPCLDSVPPCLPPIFFPQPIKYKFRLLRTFRGCPPNTIFFGQSSISSASCGVSLQKGSVYLLYLGTQIGSLTLPFGLSSCQGNLLFSGLRKGQLRFLRRQSRRKRNMCMM